MASTEATTSSAVNGLPSVNVTPRRRVYTYVLASGCFHDAASPGPSFPDGSTDSRDSWASTATR